MGYTHYWDQNKDFTKRQWTRILKDANALLTQPLFRIPLEDVTFSTEEIRFNGVGNDGHETFLVTRTKAGPKKSPHFNFCKTARKPYDLFVGLILSRINHYAKGVLTISSDGDWESDWAEIRDAYKSLYGPELENFLL